MNESTPSQVPWKERRKQQLRDEFVDTARKLFTERGIEATSVDDIVGAAGVAKGTFYLYFKSKAELVTQVVSALLDDLESRISRALSGAPQDAPTKLRLVIKTQVEFVLENRKLAALLWSDRPADVTDDMRDKAAGVTSALYERIIRTGMLQANYREVDARLAAAVLSGILAVLVREVLDADGSADGLELTALDFFERGVRRA